MVGIRIIDNLGKYLGVPLPNARLILTSVRGAKLPQNPSLICFWSVQNLSRWGVTDFPDAIARSANVVQKMRRLQPIKTLTNRYFIYELLTPSLSKELHHRSFSFLHLHLFTIHHHPLAALFLPFPSKDVVNLDVDLVIEWNVDDNPSSYVKLNVDGRWSLRWMCSSWRNTSRR
ncbi:hypothetical protein LguiB_027215 [Lonicera macranthoides]